MESTARRRKAAATRLKNLCIAHDELLDDIGNHSPERQERLESYRKKIELAKIAQQAAQLGISTGEIKKLYGR